MTMWWLLGLWVAVAALWWLIALVLVALPRERPVPGRVADARRVSVFKPVPGALGAAEFERIMGCVESFASALDANAELLIGYDAPDGARIRGAVARMRERHPAAEIRLIAHAPREHHANPKISRMRDLAAHARGELWLWSDADIIAPPGLLTALRPELAAGIRCVVCPYVIEQAATPGEYLDKFFVNVEFHPGVLLLARTGRLRLGFGAGMLFESREFRRRIDWNFLGACLADDYHLGRLLSPARLSRIRVTSLPSSSDWRGAWTHYLRWHKTIRWSQPGPYAMQLAVMPVLGWLVWLALNPWHPGAWLGLLGVLLLDSVVAVSLCRLLGCPVPARHFGAALLWSLARGFAWATSWLPLPVFWCGRKWRAPYQMTPQAD